MMIYPICGRQYFEPSATSRNEFGDVCPVVGVAESIVDFREEMRKEVIIRLKDMRISGDELKHLRRELIVVLVVFVF